MPDLYARPLGPDGEPVDPMRWLGAVEHVRVSRPREYFHRGGPIRTDRPSAPVEFTFPRSMLTIGASVLFFTNAATAPPPLSRGTAWRDGALAACQHQLTGPPETLHTVQFPRHTYPWWYARLCIEVARRAYVEHSEMFDPTAWLDPDEAVAQFPVRSAYYAPPPVARDYPSPGRAHRVPHSPNLWQHRTDFMPHYPK